MTLEELLGGDVGGDLLVCFTADWCQPCKWAHPALEQVVAEQGMALVEVDVDQYPEIAETFAVQGLPTVIRLQHGTETARTLGAKQKAELGHDLGFAYELPQRSFAEQLAEDNELAELGEQMMAVVTAHDRDTLLRAAESHDPEALKAALGDDWARFEELSLSLERLFGERLSASGDGLSAS